jgi:thiosulfate/3-mercaptopyruvate sulfurtransferase
MRSRLLSLGLIAGCLTQSTQAQSTREQLLVSPAWLSEHLKDPKLVLLQVGIMDGPTEFAKGHIPGARYIDMSDISLSSMNHKDSLMLELLATDELRSKLSALGISDDSRIVVYSAMNDISPATRVMLTLDYAGLGARSALLDGGQLAWTKAGHSLSTSAPSPPVKGTLSPLRTHTVVITMSEVQRRLHDPAFHLIDARAASYYDGVDVNRMSETKRGHIPGAKSIPFMSVSDDASRLKPSAELSELFSAAGIGPRDTVVAYCHVGQQATAVLFAARALGHPVLLFDGSFQEWGRSTLPVENTATSKK